MKPNLPRIGRYEEAEFRVLMTKSVGEKKKGEQTERDRAALKRVIESIAAALKMIAESSQALTQVLELFLHFVLAL